MFFPVAKNLRISFVYITLFGELAKPFNHLQHNYKIIQEGTIKNIISDNF